MDIYRATESIALFATHGVAIMAVHAMLALMFGGMLAKKDPPGAERFSMAAGYCVLMSLLWLAAAIVSWVTFFVMSGFRP